MATDTTGQGMKTPPARRRRGLVLWLMLALSLSLIGGTVLLSNDMRHLRGLAERLGYSFDKPKPVAALPRTSPPPPRPRPPVKPVLASIEHDPRLMEAPLDELAAAFFRTWWTTGPAICEALRKAGIETTPWRAAAMSGDTFECTFQQIYKQDAEKPLSSVFVIIRGDRTGAIANMRAKLVGPETDTAGKLDPAAMRIFETLLAQPHWQDFSAMLAAIRELKDAKEESFGASISFARETTSDNSFNFIIAMKAAPGPQVRTRAYFSAARWLEMPEQPPSEKRPPYFR
ncbi:DUF6030 family protein [Rhizobium sp. 21-4511-3d]